jgi:hypothetical protein
MALSNLERQLMQCADAARGSARLPRQKERRHDVEEPDHIVMVGR